MQIKIIKDLGGLKTLIAASLHKAKTTIQASSRKLENLNLRQLLIVLIVKVAQLNNSLGTLSQVVVGANRLG